MLRLAILILTLLLLAEAATDCRVCSSNTYISGDETAANVLNSIHPIATDCSTAVVSQCPEGQDCHTLDMTIKVNYTSVGVGVGRRIETKCTDPANLITCEMWQGVYEPDPVPGSGINVVIETCGQSSSADEEAEDEDTDDDTDEDTVENTESEPDTPAPILCESCWQLTLVHPDSSEEVVTDNRFYYLSVGSGEPSAPPCSTPATVECLPSNDQQAICQTYNLVYSLGSEEGTYSGLSKGCGSSANTCEAIKEALAEYYSPDETVDVTDCDLMDVDEIPPEEEEEEDNTVPEEEEEEDNTVPEDEPDEPENNNPDEDYSVVEDPVEGKVADNGAPVQLLGWFLVAVVVALQ